MTTRVFDSTLKSLKIKNTQVDALRIKNKLVFRKYIITFASSKNKNIINQSKKIFSVSNITDSNKGKTKNNIFNKINRQLNEIDKTKKLENTDRDINVISYKEAVGKDKRTY